MKTFGKLLTFSFCLLLVTAFFSCDKKEDNNPPSGNEIEFWISTSANARISTVIYTNAEGEAKHLTDVNTNTWSGKISAQASVKVITLSATGTAADATGTMTVQIKKGGKVVSENTASGQVLSATTVYTVAE